MNLSENVIKINQLLVEIFNDILQIEQNSLKSGNFKDVSITEMHTVEAVGMYEERTTTEVARVLRVTTGTLTIAVNNLVKKGYVDRVRSEEDRRVVRLKLTKRGKLLYRVHEKFHSDMVKNSVSGLQDDEELILLNALTKVNAYFKEKYALLEKESD